MAGLSLLPTSVVPLEAELLLDSDLRQERSPSFALGWLLLLSPRELEKEELIGDSKFVSSFSMWAEGVGWVFEMGRPRGVEG